MNSQAMQPTRFGTVYGRVDDAAAAARDPFFAAWKKGAELIGGEAFPFAQGGINTWTDAQLGALPALLKTLNSLDLPRPAADDDQPGAPRAGSLDHPRTRHALRPPDRPPAGRRSVRRHLRPTPHPPLKGATP